jgi:glycosyltransferase involved in cell wall biosynthesis
MRLLVFSGVHHHLENGQTIAHAGFVREMDVWAGLFEQVLIIAPNSDTAPKADDIPYAKKNIELFTLCQAFSSDGLIGKLRLFLQLPKWLIKTNKLIKPDDVIMARGPDSIGFLGYLVTRYRKNIRFAKYADQWENFEGEPKGYRLQKTFYKARSFGGLVQIYGPNDPKRPHLVPFITSSINQQEWLNADPSTYIHRRPHDPFRLLFVGRLVYAKGVDILLQSVNELIKNGYNLILTIVGDGPESKELASLADSLQISSSINFTGRLGWADLKKFYESADLFIHPSRKEGFGKVMIEAMTYALPIIGADVGISRQILGENKAGIIIQSESVEALVSNIKEVIENYGQAQEMGLRGRKLAEKYLLDRLESRYQEFINQLLD